jgi:hypothetical protein
MRRNYFIVLTATGIGKGTDLHADMALKNENRKRLPLFLLMIYVIREMFQAVT